ncbi:hypothetical protein Dimus_035783 [Dionaea muscipula]
MSTQTLTFNTTDLFLAAHRTIAMSPPSSSSSSQPPPPPPPATPLSLSLLTSNTPLPIIPHSFPCTKIIPKSRFLVDAFSVSGDFSVSYFLSHFHSDHYTGLNPTWSRGIIFCSELTSRLLVNVLNIWPQFIVQLPLNRTVLVDGSEVTLIDANHCPGAVQFLFKIPVGGGKFERYVHTGDFRYCDAMKLDHILGEFVGADAVFLDTTYCNPKFSFPSQEESIDYVVRVVERVGVENRGKEKNVLFLVATYVVGKEKILLEISRRCNRRIHVDSRKMTVLRALGYGDDGVFTEEESVTDVHVVGWNVLGETWPYYRPNFVRMAEIMTERGYSKVVGFVPTGWTHEVKKNKFAVRTKDCFEVHLVPYSEHSNYEELRDYVRFLKPKRVIPTVGLDVQNVDSKDAAKMKKHFAGLVNEMANKQEFLMGFHRASSQKDEKMVDDFTGGSNMRVECVQELEPPEVEAAGTACPVELTCLMGFHSASCLKDEKMVDDSTVGLNVQIECLQELEPPEAEVVGAADPEDISMLLGDKEKEDIIEELRDCLPMWVAQDQMLELINISGRNIVEAVSYFYEHETEFHEQSNVCKKLLFTSQSQSKSDSKSSTNHGSALGSLQKVGQVSKTQIHKPLNLKYSAGVSISPGKRRRNQASKANKKAITNSNIGGGIKQATITTFFNKLAQSTSQEDSAMKQATVTNSFNKLAASTSQDDFNGPMTGECTDNAPDVPNHDVFPYGEVLEKFLQLTNCGQSSRSHAIAIIERARGDINVALDMYYDNSEIFLGVNQMQLGTHIERVLCEGDVSSSSHVKEISSKHGKISSDILTSLADSGSSTLVSLPLEKYSPLEHACWKDRQPAPYMHLARTFDLLGSEKGKIKATSMLCNMFRSLLALSPKDVLPAVYLCTNKIAPDHENMELNIGGSLVTAALQEACGTNRNKIREMYNRLGDLGDVAQECRQTQSLLIPPSPLLIQDVFSTLREISIQTGSGSTGRKKNLIVGLMRSCRDKEMKFIVRTLVRNLRIGAMMKTVLPALGQAVAMDSIASSCQWGTKDIKEKLQRVSAEVIDAYNILPNLDVLVPSLLSKGIQFSSNTLIMVPGIPIRPMLAKITNGVPQALKLFEKKAFTCEYKYDGQRAQIHKFADGTVRLYSRNGDETTSKFPDVVSVIQDACKSSTGCFIIDAEVVAVDRKDGGKLLSFQELSSREKGGKASAVALDRIEVDVCTFVFDIMLVNGEQILNYPLRQRRNYMKDLFDGQKSGCLEFAKEITIEADDAFVENDVVLSKMNAFLEDALNSSGEGIMVKCLDVDAGYFPSKRADSWLKVKRDYVEGLNDSLDLVPIGAWHGNGRKAGWYSPFLVACYNPDTEEFESVCRVMSGFSDAFYTEMKDFFSEDKIMSKKPTYYRTAEAPPMWFSLN